MSLPALIRLPHSLFPSTGAPGQELILQPKPTAVLPSSAPLVPDRATGNSIACPLDKPIMVPAIPYFLTQEGPGSPGLSCPWVLLLERGSDPCCQGSLPLVPRCPERGDVRTNTRARIHTYTSASLPAALADVREPGFHSPGSHHPQHSSSFFHLKIHSLRTTVHVKNKHTNQGTNLVFLSLALIKTLFSKATWTSPVPPAPLPWAESAFATRLGSGSLPLSHGGPPTSRFIF